MLAIPSAAAARTIARLAEWQDLTFHFCVEGEPLHRRQVKGDAHFLQQLVLECVVQLKLE